MLNSLNAIILLSKKSVKMPGFVKTFRERRYLDFLNLLILTFKEITYSHAGNCDFILDHFQWHLSRDPQRLKLSRG